MRSIGLNTTLVTFFDLTAPDRVDIEIWSDKNPSHAQSDENESDVEWFRVDGYIFFGNNPVQLVEEYTSSFGKMKALPTWATSGAVVGMVGGTDVVRTAYKKVKDAGVDVVALW